MNRNFLLIGLSVLAVVFVLEKHKSSTASLVTKTAAKAKVVSAQANQPDANLRVPASEPEPVQTTENNPPTLMERRDCNNVVANGFNESSDGTPIDVWQLPNDVEVVLCPIGLISGLSKNEVIGQVAVLVKIKDKYSLLNSNQNSQVEIPFYHFRVSLLDNARISIAQSLWAHTSEDSINYEVYVREYVCGEGGCALNRESCGAPIAPNLVQADVLPKFNDWIGRKLQINHDELVDLVSQLSLAAFSGSKDAIKVIHQVRNEEGSLTEVERSILSKTRDFMSDMRTKGCLK